MKRLIFFAVLAGCATHPPLTEAEKEAIAYKNQIERERWDVCAELYNRARVPTVHIGHVHGERDRVLQMDIRIDLRNHDCQRIMERMGIW